MDNNTFSNRLIFAVFMFFFSLLTIASPMEGWESWALDNHPDNNCPWITNTTSKKACIWPGRLTLKITNSGAHFELKAQTFGKKAFLPLPGNQKHWPSSASIDGFSAPIIEKDKKPYLSLPAGNHTIRGTFTWSAIPGQLAMPSDIAIISLQVNGNSRQPDRRPGKLIFSSNTASTKLARNSLQIEVYRALHDGIPVAVETQIKLSVSGKAREITIGKVMLDQTHMLALHSPLPARIESNGNLRIQVTPGEHKIHITSRFTDNPTHIKIKPQHPEWPTYEYFSFQSDASIRQAKLSGPISIDTSQINMPGEWLDLPTYRLGKDDTLTITTEYRGDYSPPANELNIRRDLWLDFDGAGITTLDRINGTMNKDWRINAVAGSQIGRATVDGEPVLITKDQGVEGIEVRSPSIELEAVTKLASVSNFPASGWDAQADQYNATLHLPPGWRVLHAAGVDHISGSWISQWDLWDVFLMLVIIAATRKLIGLKTAIAAGIAYLVALHEPGSPLLLIPVLLVIIALLPLISGRLKSSLSTTAALLAAALVLSIISFAVSTFRLAIYPSLERPEIGEYQANYGSRVNKFSSLADTSMEAAMEPRMRKQRDSMVLEEVVVTAQKRTDDMYQVSENDKVQTGPGLPTWTWNAAHFRASGPVSANQQLSVYYSPPLTTSIWRVISVLLVAFYSGFVLMRLSQLIDFKSTKSATSTATTPALVALLLALCSSVNSPDTFAQSYPPEYLMEELEQRLTRPPECLPGCASLNNGRITINGKQLNIAFEAYADASIALPLPGAHDSWQLQQVLVDGAPAPLRSQRNLFIHLQKGNHRIEITGLVAGDNAAINFPLPIHNIEVSAQNWIVEGLIDGRVRGNTLSLRSIDERTKREIDTLKPDPAPSFVSVHRSFTFRKQWRVTTTLERLAPQQGAISLSVPLLPNEKLLSDVGKVTNGTINVQLGHRQKTLSWTSSMEPTDQLTLTAATADNYVEQWTFAPSSLWRLGYEGIPPIKSNDQLSAFEPTFKPWPGESLKVDIRRPAGVPGATHTVESATLTLSAGKQIQRAKLFLKIRSSLGEDYPIGLPAGAEVLSFSIDERAMNIPAGNRIKVPLQPGFQQVHIEFQQLSPMGVINTTPIIELPDGATNIHIKYSLPRDRWPLYLNGPSIGPAMLYWGVLCVIIIGAIVLPSLASKTGLKMPINVTGWLLLGIGLSTVNSYGVLIIAVMFFLLALRKQHIDPDNLSRAKFNTLQCLIVLWVFIAAMSMVSAIPMGLLSNPEMKVVGNGSYSHSYNYYHDIVSNNGFPTVTVFSVPILAYRIVMLLWSLWLATQIIKWAGWGWSCFAEKCVWKAKENKIPEPE